MDKDVIVKESDDAFIIKMVEKSEFWETWKKIRSFSKDFNKKDIDNAIRWAQKSFGGKELKYRKELES